MTSASGILLAGGESKRMGTDKAFLPLQGRPLIEWTLEALSQVADEVVIVTKSPWLYSYLGTRLTGDRFPGKGTLGGLYSGLIVARNRYSFTVGCDMPFLNPDLLLHLLYLAEGWDVVVPRRPAGCLEPLHAVYSQDCVKQIEALLATGQLSILDLLPRVKTRYVNADDLGHIDSVPRSFVNINTPEDLALAEGLAADNPARAPLPRAHRNSKALLRADTR